MIKPKVLSVNNLLPEYTYSNDHVIEFVKEWVKDQSEELQKKAIKIFQNSNIIERHSIAPIETLFKKRTVGDSNQLYAKKAIELSTRALRDNLEQSNISPTDIDLLITTSCTGFMIPAIDSFIINALNMRNNIKRMPITQIGCTAGATSYIYAHDFLKAYPDKKVAIVNLEFPTNTIQLNDFSMENIIGTAVFADGVSTTIIGGSEQEGLSIIDSEMFHIENTENLLGYDLIDTGFNMRLDKNLPNVVIENIKKIAEPFLRRNDLKIRNLNSILVHPGGFRIVEFINKFLLLYGKNVKESKQIMKNYGNLSSATLGFILKEYLDNKTNNSTDNVLMMAFGPGFSAHQLLLKWEN